jgi:hypothetical protein
MTDLAQEDPQRTRGHRSEQDASGHNTQLQPLAGEERPGATLGDLVVFDSRQVAIVARTWSMTVLPFPRRTTSSA